MGRGVQAFGDGMEITAWRFSRSSSISVAAPPLRVNLCGLPLQKRGDGGLLRKRGIPSKIFRICE